MMVEKMIVDKMIVDVMSCRSNDCRWNEFRQDIWPKSLRMQCLYVFVGPFSADKIITKDLLT